MFGLSQLWRFSAALCLIVGLSTTAPGVAQESAEAVGEAEGVPEDQTEPMEMPEDPADAAAMTHFHDGRGLYDRGAYREALVQFRASYTLSHRAVLFYNYSLCYQRLQEYGDAVNYLERYLLEVVNVPNRGNLELRLHRMREAAEEEEQQHAANPSGSQGGAWAAFGVGAAGALTALIAGPMALSERSRLDEQPCAQTSTCDASALRRRALIADIGLGVAVLGTVTGVVLWFVLKPSSDGREATRITPSFAIDGRGARAGAQLVGHF